MANYISTLPLWLIALFITSILFSITLVANPVKQAALHAGMTAGKSRNIQLGIIGFYVIYLVYVSILSLTGWFYINTVPPRVIVFTTIPLTIILFAIVLNTGLFKKILSSITLESLIAMHVFRLVGSFFIILYFYRLLPADFALSSGIGDIITAVLALPVAKMAAKKRPWSIPVVYAWNIFGTLDIINLIIIAFITASKSIISGAHGDLEMTLFPFSWFPAFAPATILFLHTVIFQKLRQIRSKQNID